MRFCRNFCTPKLAFLGRGGQHLFRPAPNRSQNLHKTCLVIPNPFQGYGGRLELTLILGQKIPNSERRFGQKFCMWVPAPPKHFSRSRVSQKYLQIFCGFLLLRKMLPESVAENIPLLFLGKTYLRKTSRKLELSNLENRTCIRWLFFVVASREGKISYSRKQTTCT